jgi:hypothetical protein
MAEKKTAAKKATSKPTAEALVQTVAQANDGVPGISPELVEAREKALAAEPEVKETPPGEPGISPELVELRNKDLEREAKRDAALAKGLSGLVK